MNLKTFSEKLYEISQHGYIPTLRKGDTGVGQTLEQTLGLTENNLALPDIGDEVELKAFRKNTTSMLTLFTKEPLSNIGRGRDRYILENFGYSSTDTNKNLNLYTTVSSTAYNSQGFILHVEDSQLRLCHKSIPLDVYWPYELLKQVFEAKLPSLVVVLADSIGEDFNESFHYNEAYYLKGFSFNGFISAIKDGYIKIDLRMHMRANNTVRNHGTAFRIVKSHLYSCFDFKEKII